MFIQNALLLFQIKAVTTRKDRNIRVLRVAPQYFVFFILPPPPPPPPPLGKYSSRVFCQYCFFASPKNEQILYLFKTLPSYFTKKRLHPQKIEISKCCPTVFFFFSYPPPPPGKSSSKVFCQYSPLVFFVQIINISGAWVFLLSFK